MAIAGAVRVALVEALHAWADDAAECGKLFLDNLNQQAFSSCRKAAEQGDVDAQYTLGTLYENGLGVKQDDAEAVKWYLKAAEQGDARAQINLGAMYDKGQGVK